MLDLLLNVLSIGVIGGVFAALSALASPRDDRGDRFASIPFGLPR